MIGKTNKGKGFRGALEYVNKDGSVQIDTNLAGKNPREMATEFGAVRRLRPGIGKPVVHTSLALPPNEHLSDDQWRAAAQKWLFGMGHEDCQFVVTRHTDTDHEHIHIITSRVTMVGEVVSDSNDYKRSENIMRTLEKEFNLRQVEPSAETSKKAPTKGEIEESLRTGKPSTRAQLQQICDRAAVDCSGIGEYVDRLQSIGVAVTASTQMNDTKLTGLVLELDGVKLKASDLGKAYTPTGLSKRGIHYDKDRDFTAISRANASHAQRPDHGADRGVEGDGRGEHSPTVSQPNSASRIDVGLDPIDLGVSDGVLHDDQRGEPNASTDEGRGANAAGTQIEFTPTIRIHDQKPEVGSRTSQPNKNAASRTIQRVVHRNTSGNRHPFGNGGHNPYDIYAALNCGISSADSHTAEQKAKLKKRYNEQLAAKLKDAKLTYTKAGLIIYHRGGRAVDRGDTVSIAKITDRNISLMLDIASGKGWEKLTLTGSEEFRRKAAVEAVKHGFMLDDPELDKYAREQIAAQSSSISPTPPAPATPTAAPPNKATSLKEQVAAQLAAAARNCAPSPQQIAAAERERQAQREQEEENDFGHDM